MRYDNMMWYHAHSIASTYMYQITSLKSELNTVYKELHTAQDRIMEYESTHHELQHRLDVMTEAKRTKGMWDGYVDVEFCEV